MKEEVLWENARTTEEARQEILRDMRHFDFAFLLGAGASLSGETGITSPESLAWRWFQEIWRHRDKEHPLLIKLEQYVAQTEPPKKEDIVQSLGYETCYKIVSNAINTDFNTSFDTIETLKILVMGIAESYFEIADMLLRICEEEGRPFIDKSIQEVCGAGKVSPGYKALARLMYQTSPMHHNVAITTNFDDLLEAALMSHRTSCSLRGTTTLVGHHGSMQLRLNTDLKDHPFVLKVHNDQFFEPLNAILEVRYYSESLCNAINRLLDNRAILVLGYGGADDHLMKLLLDAKTKRIYWGCYDSPPRTRAFDRLSKKKSVFLFQSGDFCEFISDLEAKHSPVADRSSITMIEKDEVGIKKTENDK